MFQKSIAALLALAGEALGDDLAVFLVGEPDDEHEIADDHDRHDDERGPAEGVVEAGGDDVVGGSRIGDAERRPLLLLDGVLVERLPGRVRRSDAASWRRRRGRDRAAR